MNLSFCLSLQTTLNEQDADQMSKLTCELICNYLRERLQGIGEVTVTAERMPTLSELQMNAARALGPDKLPPTIGDLVECLTNLAVNLADVSPALSQGL